MLTIAGGIVLAIVVLALWAPIGRLALGVAVIGLEFAILGVSAHVVAPLLASPWAVLVVMGGMASVPVYLTWKALKLPRTGTWLPPKGVRAPPRPSPPVLPGGTGIAET